MADPLPKNQQSSPKTSGASKAPPAKPKQAIETWLRTAYLESDDGNCGVPLSIRDFINYLRYETPATADFTTEMLDWALETIERSFDTVIVPITISQVLYGIGTGQLKDDGSNTLQQQYPEYHKALGGKRYVFLPVNNGFKSEYEAISKDTEISRSSRKKERPRNHITTPRFGGHWSFIVIDTQFNTASYIDDMVKVENRGKKGYKISNVDINGPIAGRVLCGFDTFMQRQKGQLQTSTLKWVPRHLARSQRDQRDAGPCGPYVWRSICFILENRSRTLGGPGGLKAFFSQEQKNKIQFDLFAARRRIQQQLELKRERKEASSKLPPYNLTPSMISEFLTPKFLRQIDPGSILKGLLDILEPPAEFEEIHPNLDHQAAALAYWKAEQLKSGKLLGEWTENDKKSDWKVMFPNLSWKDALLVIEKNFMPAVREEQWRKRQEYAHERDPLLLPVGNYTFWFKVWRGNGMLRRGYNLKNGLDPNHPDPEPPANPNKVDSSRNTNSTATSNGEKSPPIGGDQGVARASSIPAKTRKKTFPKGLGPNQLPNFATDDVKIWFEEIRDLWENRLSGFQVMRALLHRTYKGSFMNESKEDLVGRWSQDLYAFTLDERKSRLVDFTPTEIAQRMDDCYVTLDVPLFANLSDEECAVLGQIFHVNIAVVLDRHSCLLLQS